jgi:hypothetical protein
MTNLVRTTIAIFVCCVLILPASLIGGIADVGYRWGVDYLGWPAGASDTAVSQVFTWFLVNGVPALIHGAISSSIAILITARLFQSADLRLVGVGTISFYTLLYLVLLLIKGSVTQATIEAAVQLVGLWLGIAFCVHPADDRKHKPQGGIIS